MSKLQTPLNVRRSYLTAPLLLTTALTLTHSAFAAGYGLREASTTAMGAAYAGASATGTDASFLAYNPASLAQVSTYDSSISMIGLLPTSSASYSTATTSAATPAGGPLITDEFVKTAYVPELAARVRLSPKLSGGLVIFAPWGLATGYEDDWAGRYYARQTRLMTVNITPTLAYQFSDRFSVAVGPQIQFAKGTLSNAIDIGTIGLLFSVPGSVPGAQDGNGTFKADGWAYGFVVGAMGELTHDITVGLSYRSAVNHTLKGTLDFTLDTAGVGAALNSAAGIFADTPAQTTLTTPDTVKFGTRVTIDDQWTALFEADWTNWSRFRELRVVSANPFQPDDVTVANWEDSWFFALGVEYFADDQWTWRGGVALDQSPVPDSTRGPRIPDADRYWVSLGLTYRADDRLSFALSYAHMFLPSETVVQSATLAANALRGNIVGTTEADANVIGIQLNYRLP